MAGWRARAACLDADPAIFSPEVGEDGRHAKAVCAGCPVIDDCLEHALHHELFDVWGGLTGPERARMRRRLGIAQPQMPSVHRAFYGCGTPTGYKHHRRDGTDTCQACREANRTYKALWREDRGA